jgi:hypothetical protein
MVFRSLTPSRVAALGVLAVMLMHTAFKMQCGTLPELLWACNVASFGIVLGLWFGNLHLVGMGFLWHLCVGEPGWLYGVWYRGWPGWTSVMVHTLPTLAAAWALKRQGLPRSAPYLACGLFVLLVPVSYLLTPPEMNVNLAHQRLWFLQQRFPGVWEHRAAFTLGLLMLLLVGDTLARPLFKGKALAQA